MVYLISKGKLATNAHRSKRIKTDDLKIKFESYSPRKSATILKIRVYLWLKFPPIKLIFLYKDRVRLDDLVRHRMKHLR